MAPIDDPWHSRPIDVHRWSDHPEVKGLVDHIWDEVMPSDVVNNPGPAWMPSGRLFLEPVGGSQVHCGVVWYCSVFSIFR